MKFYEKNEYRGHLEIFKDFGEGPQLVYSTKNIVVSGMGTGISRLFVGDGSTETLDYAIKYYQLGVSGSLEKAVTSSVEVEGSLTDKEYGVNVSVIKKYNQIANNNILIDRYFGLIFNNNIKILNESTVEYQIVVDRYTANKIIRDKKQLPLNEIGLFLKNPYNYDKDTPILVAYRNFDPILKSDNFSLIFKWSITKL